LIPREKKVLNLTIKNNHTMAQFILFKDLIKAAHRLGITTRGLTYSQILKHVNAAKNK
jgi:hypothetical protein